ncbi:unnamed protein product [Mesocestoides corti]|uniref:Transmembrane protein n=1 Tax=Mesocestoides corti TaxID=53468 RepID=A0A0R3UIY5_MESCO|nr:unnamed protein product [Mesocestoides corti]
MNHTSKFNALMKLIFLRNSQAFAAIGFVGASVFSYYVQPYLEVFNRWNHVKTRIGREMEPNSRVVRIANSAFAKLKVPEALSQKVDIFLTKYAESVALGSLDTDSDGYAFIGLPYFSVYEDSSDIPLEDLTFSSPLFPYAAHSSLGKKRLQLMHISDSALEFLVAREVARLLGSAKLADCRKSETSKFSTFFPSPRMSARIASLSLIATLYLSYQTCYALNRLLRLHIACPRSLRVLNYLGVAALMVLCQRQILVSWQHHVCLALDKAVCEACSDFYAGGIEYYKWKREWNSFWTQVLPVCRKAMRLLRQVSAGSLTPELSPALKYQVQMALSDPAILQRDPSEYYFIPPSIVHMNRSSKDPVPLLEDCSLSYLSAYHLPAYDVNSRQGDEKFASDGETLRLNLPGLLSFGVFPAWLAFIFEMLSFPATCGQRKTQLEFDLLAS